MKREFSNFVDLIQDRSLEYPDKLLFTFLPDGETAAQTLTYPQLAQQARAIAAHLQSRKAAGERALLLYPPGLDFITAFLGCLYAGVIPVPAYPPRANRSFERLQTIIADSQAVFALTVQELVSTIEGRLTKALSSDAIACITTDTVDLTTASDYKSLLIQPDQIAFLQYTSGSTGVPKGVMVSHSNLIHNSQLINHYFQDTPESRGASWLPPYHDMGLIGGILQPIYVGIPIVLMPPVAFLQRPYRWLKVISQYRVTTSGAPNFAYDLCAKQVSEAQRENLDLSAWKLAFSGAEPVRAETIDKFTQAFAGCGFQREAFYPCYGMAETTLIVSGGKKSAPPVYQSFDTKAIQQRIIQTTNNVNGNSVTLVGCGRQIDSQKVIIADPNTLNSCSTQEIGEIWVAGPSVTQGYWNRDQQTTETFHAYLADTGEGPYLRTGDLGFFQEGELFVTGRLKDLIIIRGRNHYPQDIELSVQKCHPAIRESCEAAFSVDIDDDEQLVIVCEIKRNYLRRLQPQQVITAIRKTISENHEILPYAVVLLKTGSIPKTSSGKIQRHACKSQFLNNELIEVGHWRQDEIDNIASSEPSLSEFSEKQTKVSDESQTFAVDLNEDQRQIQQWLIQNIAQRLGVPTRAINVREPFASCGLDSIQAVQLSADLEDWLGRQLPPTLAYDYPSIQALAKYLGGEQKTTTASVRHDLLSVSSRSADEAIAIVGIGCRFPGASNPDAFWQLLQNGEDAITVAKARWQGEEFGGFLEQVDAFDPQFFGISPREAETMDPQQRLLLEVAWESLENAGLAPDQMAGSLTGVFIGMSSSDYSQLRSQKNLAPDAYLGTGNAHSIGANRLSYLFDFRGPSLSVDTACSSSLVAIHLAVKSLRDGECDCALAGGVNLMLSPELTQTFTLAGMMAADGRCKTFDAEADGYVRGEGCGLVVLKRVSDAVGAGDNILAVISGSAINQDGRSNGLTAPNGLSQQAVIRQALTNAHLEPQEISYLETHGTGTSLGDPIEVNSLKQVLMPGRESSQPLFLGSVKTNIGHLEAAAGIAGVIKVVLSLQHRQIPPNLHFETLNPHIDLSGSLVKIPRKLYDWGSDRRRAGISSFGFGGTNAHVILEDASSVQVSGDIASEDAAKTNQGMTELQRLPHALFTLSAKTQPALRSLADAYAQYLREQPDISLVNLCFSLSTGRNHFTERLAIAASSTQQLQEKLCGWQNGSILSGILTGEAEQEDLPKIAFLFTGQGSQYAGMGRQLYQTQPVFRSALEHCADILDAYLDRPLLEILYPEAPSRDSYLDKTAYTQPALFALEYALAKLWLSWGIQPTAVMGHSVGEYVAACLAGVFNLADGLKLIVHRAKLMQALPASGAMVAILSDHKTLQPFIQPYQRQVAIAAYNGPRNLVISGEKTVIDQLITQLEKARIKTKILPVSHAFHCPLMQPMLAEFKEFASQVNYSPPTLTLVSNVTGKNATADIATAEYWVDHIIQPVQFQASLQCLLEQNYDTFLEIGPKPTLLGMGRAIVDSAAKAKARQQTAHQLRWLPSLRPRKEDWQVLNQSLATLWSQGMSIDWQNVYQEQPCRKLWGLPNYPFQRQRYWLTDADSANGDRQTQPPDYFYQAHWQLKPRGSGNEQNVLQANTTAKWLIFADDGGLAAAIADILACSGETYHLVYPISNDTSQQPSDRISLVNPQQPKEIEHLFQRIGDFDQILYLWGLNTSEIELTTPTILEQTQQLCCGSLLYLLQTLTKQEYTAKLWLITHQAQKISDTSHPIAIAQSSLWGLGKVIALEHPEYWGGMIDVGMDSAAEAAASLLSEIRLNDGETYLGFRNSDRYVLRLQRTSVPAASLAPLRNDASYLITGGLGALGLQLAQYLTSNGAKHLILMGRSQPSAKVKVILDSFAQSGVEVLTIQGDVSQADDVETAFSQCSAKMPTLRGIFHCAGVLDDGLLQGLSWPRFASVLAPKVQGAWNLHQQSQVLSLDHFVLFSSIASCLGSPGQGNYATANAFLDGLALYRRHQGLSALSLNWGPIAEGMAQRQGLALKGLTSLSSEQALAALSLLLSQETGQMAIFDVNWSLLSQQFPVLRRTPYVSELLDTAGELDNQLQPNPNIFEQLLALSPKQRENDLGDYLKKLISHILQLAENNITLTTSLIDLGMDSLMVMEAINQLKHDLRLMLYPREFYERPKIGELAAYLAIEFQRSHGEPSTALMNGTTDTLNNSSQILDTTATSTPTILPRLQQKLPPVAFILSSPRSGSTLLSAMLARHSQLFCPPELHLLPFNTLSDRQQELGMSHLGEGLQRALMDLKQLDATESQALIQQWQAQQLSIPEIYEILQKLSGNRRLIDKSPTYANQYGTLERAEAIFTEAKYIHLVRHPYAVIESFNRLRMDKLLGVTNTDPYQLAETIWAKSNRNILDFTAQLPPERYHLIRYEDLVTQPQSVIQQLCGFLEIPFDTALLQPYGEKDNLGGVHKASLSVGDPNFRKHSRIEPRLANIWETIQLPQSLNAQTCHTALAFNYTLPKEQSVETQTAQPTSPTTKSATTMKESFINVRGLNLCLCSWGDVTAPLVLCLHGILEQGAAWQEVAIRLAERGYWVVAPDLRGHGRSDHVREGSSYNLLDFLGDIDAITKHLTDRSFTLIGHSLGSVIAAMFASIRPQWVKHLSLIETILPSPINIDETAQRLANQLEAMASPPKHPVFATVEAAAKRLRRGTPGLPQSLSEKLATRLTKACEGGVCWRWDAILRSRTGISTNGIDRDGYLSLLPEIKAPITLIYGDRSDFNRPEDLAEQQQAMPQAQRIVLTGGHNLQLETPAELVEALLPRIAL